MFNNILVLVDGSDFSLNAAKVGHLWLINMTAS